MQIFESIDELGEGLAGQILTGSPEDRWSIDAPFADRSSILYKLADDIAASECRMRPILVVPPRRDFDTGPLGLAQIVDGLARIDGDRSLAAHVADPTVTWAEKREAVNERLHDCADRVVLISDEPGRWYPAFGDRRLFSERAGDVAGLLTQQARWQVVTTGHDRSTAQRVRFRNGKAAAVLVDGTRDWNSLADEADLLHRSLATRLAASSNSEICLLVALLHLTSLAEVRRLVTAFAPVGTLAQALVTEVIRRPGYEAVTEAWASLSVARRPFEESVAQRVIADAFAARASRREPEAEDLVRCCLIHTAGDKIEVPPDLRLAVRELAPRPKVDAHDVFARHYAGKARSCPGVSLLADEMEAFHHASSADDTNVIGDLRPFFSDQLDAWGRGLSRRRLHDQAVEIFDRAIAWDPDDDYAHHYAAYNLDVDGRDANRVELHYARAIELDPDNVWWRSRFICFLITRGRVSDARRAWNDALTTLADRETAFLYENLHIWVARLLLHRMRLDFARAVIESIPKRFWRDIPRVPALERHLRHLEAADRGRTVRPFRSPVDPRSTDQPERAALRDDARGSLERWFPARIEEVDKDMVHIAVGVPVEKAGADIRRASMPRAEFDRLSLDEPSNAIGPGRFIELAYYGKSEEPTIRVLSPIPSLDPELPPLRLDPDRYLQRARANVG